MDRKVAALALGALVVLAGACGKDEPQAAPSGGGNNVGANVTVTTDNIPVDTAVVPVSVTKAPAPQAVAPEELPANVRMVTQMQGFTADEQACIGSTIKGTVAQDPSIAEVNGKMASVAGQSVVACTGGGRVAEIMAGRISGLGGTIDEEQKNCFKQSLAASDENAADLMSTLFVMNPTLVVEKLKQYESTCGFSFGVPTP